MSYTEAEFTAVNLLIIYLDEADIDLSKFDTTPEYVVQDFLGWVRQQLKSAEKTVKQKEESASRIEYDKKI